MFNLVTSGPHSPLIVPWKGFLVFLKPTPLVLDPERFNRSGENNIGFSSRKALILGIMVEKPMHDWESLSHVRWDCKYHVVIVPKYRKKVTGMHFFPGILRKHRRFG